MNLKFGDLGGNINDTDSSDERQKFWEEWGDYSKSRENDTERQYTTEHTHHPQAHSGSAKSKNQPREGIGAILSNLNKEDILLMALLYMLYEDGADKITMLALAYILLG